MAFVTSQKNRNKKLTVITQNESLNKAKNERNKKVQLEK